MLQDLSNCDQGPQFSTWTHNRKSLQTTLLKHCYIQVLFAYLNCLFLMRNKIRILCENINQLGYSVQCLFQLLLFSVPDFVSEELIVWYRFLFSKCIGINSSLNSYFEYHYYKDIQRQEKGQPQSSKGISVTRRLILPQCSSIL